ncbi:hypothetical protein GCM10007388_37690 [Pseudoduganella plicata]|uniref:Uncharacterized protein n=1 Tax=Pseudoduganella plicata TaxID=321984 RepID=A0AA88C9X6_9BURK|nr:hypothetical protein GCM10007388_37690 [Pseudoduganella plicata]
MCWSLKYVVGNPETSKRTTTYADGPGRRREILEAAAKVAANGWRVWVEHAVTGERIFESDVEKAYNRPATATA